MIRFGTHSDIPAIIEIGQRTIDASKTYDAKVDPVKAAYMLRRAINDRKMALFVAEKADQVVGFFIAMKDEEWFDLNVIVQGNHITTKINGKTIIDYTEPADRTNGSDPRKVQAGTIAIQAHDPKSKVVYKQIQIKEIK